MANMRDGAQTHFIRGDAKPLLTRNKAMSNNKQGHDAHPPTALMFNTIVESQHNYNPKHACKSKVKERQVQRKTLMHHTTSRTLCHRCAVNIEENVKHRTANCWKLNCCWLSAARGSSTPVVLARGGSHSQHNMFAMCRASK